ncbi:MAG: hypothetical protein U0574_04085 [Phycisphaerales bacterium]
MSTWQPQPDLLFAQTRESQRPDAPIEVDTLLLVVVGAHLRAELADRPLADRLVRQIRAWQSLSLEDVDAPLRPLVCTDMWYLNEPSLLERPAVVIGEPGVNAASAYFAGKLPRTVVVEDSWEIRMDPEFVDPRVCIWGDGPRGTELACDEFARRFLDPYLRAAHLM